MKELLKKSYDVVIVGGGVSGLCAAIASARHGAKTALIQNRPMLGGNASSEIRMHICGADVHGSRPGARETGIIEELLLKNRSCNDHESFHLLDVAFWEKATFQENLDLLLNTSCQDVAVEDETIKTIYCYQLSTEKHFEITSTIFVDATGDGYLSHIAGAGCMKGREAKSVFGESMAPDESDEYTMGNSLLFQSKDVGKKVVFKKPEWAYTFTEEDLAQREHAFTDAGYWWIELGGKDQDVIADGEVIRDELLKSLYGVWDHIKNSGNHDADQLVLDWVGVLPGKRESRRVVGEYILKQDDLATAKRFEDAVAYGGWPMDVHDLGGLRSESNRPNVFNYLSDVYTIPYGCFVAKDRKNLMLAGRNFSTSSMAFSSIRVMATVAVCGQAVGTAAAMAIEKQCSPSQVSQYMKELQQTLLKDDCYIPGIINEDTKDLVRFHAKKIYASSQIDECPAENVANGHARDFYDYPEGGTHEHINWDKANKGKVCNGWISEKMQGEEWIVVEFDQTYEVNEIHIKFDSNLSKEIKPSIEQRSLKDQDKGMPKELVRDFVVKCYLEGDIVREIKVEDNIYRFNRIELEDSIQCDKMEVVVKSIYGDDQARIFEIRAYSN